MSNKNIYFTKEFWSGASERAIKTLAQTLIATIPVGMGLVEIPWGALLSVAGVATLLSLLTSISNPAFTAGNPGTDLSEEAVLDVVDTPTGTHVIATPVEDTVR